MRRSFGTTSGWSAVARSSCMNRRSPLCSTFRIFMAQPIEGMRQASRYALQNPLVIETAVSGSQIETACQTSNLSGVVAHLAAVVRTVQISTASPGSRYASDPSSAVGLDPGAGRVACDNCDSFCGVVEGARFESQT